MEGEKIEKLKELQEIETSKKNEASSDIIK
jgi:hypothetical protein